MRDRGTFNFSGNLEIKKDAPLEARSLVNSYADLVKPETWTDEQGGIWKYDCMLVSCKDRPGKVYQLSPGADYTKESSWILIGDTSELNSKVQQFINSKGAPNGLASLNESGIIPSAQLPSYVDDVIEVDTFSNLPDTGESGKIYIVQDTNLTYRWSGTDYVEISKSLALGETSSTAYSGDKGKATTDKLNRIPDKLITDTVNVNQSTTEAVLNFVTYRQEAQQIGRNTLTITSATISQAGLMSSSDKTKLDGLKDQASITSDIDAVQTNLETHINNKSNPHEVTKDQVGLGNVDNTSDANKPISTATQNALNDKFSATEGNTLKQIVIDMPDLVVTGGSLRHNSDSVSLNLIQQNLKNPDDAGPFLLKFNSVTDSTAGIILPSDKSKIDKIITNGDGTKYLADNGQYKTVQGGSADLATSWNNLPDVITEGNEFNIADNNINTSYFWINYRPRSGSTTNAKNIYVGNGQGNGGFGEVHASGFFKESDIRLKSNIVPLNHTLEQICNIPTVSFDIRNKHQIGTIAQDIENDFVDIVDTDSDGMKSVDYCMLGVVAVEGIKLLKQEIEDLKKQVEELKNGR